MQQSLHGKIDIKQSWKDTIMHVQYNILVTIVTTVILVPLRMCTQLSLYRHLGMLSVVTMITMATVLLRLLTQVCPRGGHFQTTTIPR